MLMMFIEVDPSELERTIGKYETSLSLAVPQTLAG